jgi:3'(2'), 5'-bisphosphate nucleotidase
VIAQNVNIQDIISLAKEAGKKVASYYQQDIVVEHKKDHSPVTKADLASNDVLIAGLRQYGYPIFSEETKPQVYNPEGYLWIIDPLDGTSSFIKGTDDHSVMIGLTYKGEPLLGVVYQPVIDTLYYAVKGEGAYMEKEGNSHRLHVSDIATLDRARLLVSRRAPTIERFSRLIRAVDPSDVLHISSNGVKISMIADGQAELFFNPSRKLGSYDYCAPHVIIEEAGGAISYIDGSEIRYDDTWGRDGIALA